MLYSKFRLLIAGVFTIGLLAFAPTGGESFSVYLNKKLLFTHHVGHSSTAKLSLTKANLNDHLSVHYNHCGKAGSGRRMVIKDNNKVIREWKFANCATGTNKAMSVPVKDILALSPGTEQFTLYYYSEKDLPAGRLIAYLDVANKAPKPGTVTP